MSTSGKCYANNNKNYTKSKHVTDCSSSRLLFTNKNGCLLTFVEVNLFVDTFVVQFYPYFKVYIPLFHILSVKVKHVNTPKSKRKINFNHKMCIP